jgi:hypothetical protein
MIGKTLLLVCLAGYVSAQEAVYEDPSAAAGGSAAGAGYYGGKRDCSKIFFGFLGTKCREHMCKS